MNLFLTILLASFVSIVDARIYFNCSNGIRAPSGFSINCISPQMEEKTIVSDRMTVRRDGILFAELKLDGSDLSLISHHGREGGVVLEVATTPMGYTIRGNEHLSVKGKTEIVMNFLQYFRGRNNETTTIPLVEVSIVGPVKNQFIRLNTQLGNKQKKKKPKPASSVKSVTFSESESELSP